jgi:dephospho-CoA kinase
MDLVGSAPINRASFMKRIGVTGGIGSGKSTFSRMLAEHGAVYFDADQVANAIMESNPAVREKLTNLLGPNTYREDGTLNKWHVSQIVFSDRSKLDQIGKVVHPLVEEAFRERAIVAEAEGAPAVIREAALIPGERARADLDLLVAVLADKEVRIDRVMRRSKLSRKDVLDRMQAQATDDAFMEAADLVIHNNGSEGELRQTTDDFWREVVSG